MVSGEFRLSSGSVHDPQHCPACRFKLVPCSVIYLSAMMTSC